MRMTLVRWLTVAVLLWVSYSAFAQEHYVDGLQGAAIGGGRFDVEEQYFACSQSSTPACPVSFEITGSKLYAKLWLEEDIVRQFPNDEWKIRIEYQIRLHSTLGGWYNLPSRQKLEIFYDPNDAYQDIDVSVFTPDPAAFPMPNFYNKAEVRVTNLMVSNLRGTQNSPVPPFNASSVPAFVHFDLELEVERIYDFDAKDTPRFHLGNYDATKNELYVHWDYVHGADHYDIEYLVLEGDNDFIDNPIGFDFNNATRISTPQNAYRISLAYPESIILFRSRAVGRKRTGPGNTPFRKVEGRWSSPEKGTTTVLSTTYPGTSIRRHGYALVDKNYNNPNFEAYYWKGLEPNRNWQYTAVFSEDGKKKETIQFADGLLMETQRAVVINTDQNALVHQTVRDYLARPSLQILPSPQRSQGMRRYKELHFNPAQQPYNYTDFDISSSTQAPNRPSPLSTTGNEGAGHYYSDQNTQVRGMHHDFIPDAEGYPFSRTLYYNDGTGRIKAQSGIGKRGFFDGGPTGDAMQHATRYYYDKPYLEVLLMLFGNNIGFRDFYERTIVLDPNGQASVAYKDLAGRVIATSLLGDEPDNLLAIDTKPDSYPSITVDLHGPIANQVIDQALVVNEKFTSAGGRYDFKYRLPASLFRNCIDRDCSYDLTIVLLDDYGQPVPLQYNGSQHDTIHLAAMQSLQLDFWVQLEFGSYQIVKTLQPSQTAVDRAVEDYLAFNLDSLNTRACLQANPVDPADCNTDCVSLCESAYYGPENSQGIRYITDDNGQIIGERVAGINTWYSGISAGARQTVLQNIRDCIAICNSNDYTDAANYADECEIKYELLKQDMSPGGQYFDNQPDYAPTGYDQNEWLRTEISTNDMLCIRQCIGITQEFSTLDDFWNHLRINWQDDWGDVLLQYHPEYCAFRQNCCAVGCSDADSNCQPRAFSYQTCDRALTQIQQDSIDQLIKDRINDPQHNYRRQSRRIIRQLSDAALAPYFSAAELEARERAFYTAYFKYKTVQDSCTDLYIVGDPPYGATYAGFQIRYPRNPLFDNFDPSDPTAAQQTMASNNCSLEARLFTDRFLSGFPCQDTLTTAELQQLEIDIYAAALARCGQPSAAQNLSNDIRNLCASLGLPTGCYASALPEPPAGACACDAVFQFVLDVVQSDPGISPPYHLYQDPTLASRPSVQLALDTYLMNTAQKPEFANWLKNCQTVGNWYDTRDPNSYPIDARFSCDTEDQTPDFTSLDDCGAELTRYLRQLEQRRFAQEVRDSAAAFRRQYIAYCLQQAAQQEVFTKTYLFKEYHWTLYYYDQAKNLIKTVPPAGVYQKDTGHNSLLNAGDIAAAKDYLYGRSTSFVHAAHVMYTNYRYNALNAMRTQLLPDHGDPNDPTSQLTWYHYDALGRLLLSQNPYQRLRDQYSYLVYDALGRNPEAGAIQNPAPLTTQIVTNLDYLHSGNPSDDLYTPWFNTGQKIEYVSTHYDAKPASSTLAASQQQLRNRIAMIESVEATPTGPKRNYATHYSYDALGNVTDLWQQNFDLTGAVTTSPASSVDHSIKHLSYSFDLLSGNVNAIHYQRGLADYAAYRYTYDGDNRLTHAYSTTDGMLWHNEATYFYYAHGPLARVEIGPQQVFADDFVYNIAGWLTTKNASTLHTERDAGQDGLPGGLNEYVGADPFAFSLHYFTGDYQPINNSRQHVLAKLAHPEQQEPFAKLYNGNIPNLVVSMRNTDREPIDMMAYGFRYDQLNRIRSQQAVWDRNSNRPLRDNGFRVDNSSLQGGAFRTQYQFDGNGNLLTLLRNGIDSYLNMDRFDYQYDIFGTARKNNRLLSLRENANNNPYAHDIERDHDYTYDALGRLTSDPAEHIARINWNVSNRVTQITKNVDAAPGQNVDLNFHYDALGERVVKVVQTKDNSGAYLPALQQPRTWYVRDAQGNPLAIYEYRKNASGVERLVLQEFILYGSKRLGTRHQKLKVYER